MMTSIISCAVFTVLLMAAYPKESEGIWVKSCPYNINMGSAAFICLKVKENCRSDDDCEENMQCCYEWCESNCRPTTLVRKDCPKGAPKVKCSKDPCSVLKCPGYPKARCVSHNCGGCYAEFYSGGKRVCAREMPDQY